MDLMGPMQVESIGVKDMYLCVLMIFLDLLGLISLEKNQKLLMSLKGYAKN